MNGDVLADLNYEFFLINMLTQNPSTIDPPEGMTQLIMVFYIAIVTIN